MARKIVAPNTSRLVEGLRDTGYTFNASIADLVDNSIAANAEVIHVTVDLDRNQRVRVRIADDGTGMDRAGLENAMRYGSKEQISANSLSKFGMGLKTASTAFCRKVSLISRSEEQGIQEVNYATWDLDLLTEENEWYLDEGPAESSHADEFEEAMDALTALGSKRASTSGTVVLWEKVDRLLKTKQGKDPSKPRKFVDEMVNALEFHLALVFQRYLDSLDERARNIRLFINDKSIEAWDPFCTKWLEPVDADGKKVWRLQGPSGDEWQVVCRSYIFPSSSEIDDPEYKAAARISNQRQGIYLYREQRLIEGPSWLGLVGTSETHMNNLRIELSFPGELDEVFGVGIKKSGVHLDEHFAEALNKHLAPIRREAQNVARQGSARRAAALGEGTSRPSERTIERTIQTLDIPTIQGMDDGSVVLTGNEGDVTIMDATGRSTGHISIVVEDAEQPVYVQKTDTLDLGVLWEPTYIPQKGIGVSINVGHPWYQKAYLPNSTNSPLVQAIEYLFFALAQAEQNNTNFELKETYEQFKVEVSRNLNKLVRELPDSPEPEEH